MDEGIDVLICHPRLVQTGLDLIDFPVVVWLETDIRTHMKRQPKSSAGRPAEDFGQEEEPLQERRGA